MKILIAALGLFWLTAVTPPAHAQPTGDDAVREVLGHYLHGLKFNDVASLKKAFHPEAKLLFIKKDGTLGQLTQEQWYKGFETSAGKEEEGTLAIVSVEITGNMASAKIHEDYPTSIYDDYVTLLKLSEGWRIVNKVYVVEHKKPK